jgi:hypothetical protein
LRRTDLEAAKEAMSRAGFRYRHVEGVDRFLDGPDTRPRDAVHVVFAGEKVRPEYAVPVPEIDDAPLDKGIRLMTLGSLVQMKLTSFRRKDQVHVLDLIGVGHVDGSWLDRLEPELTARLKELLDNPDG